MLIRGTSLSYCAKRCSVINTNIDARKWEVTVHSVTSNTLRDAQKSCIRMISRAILGFSVNFVHKNTSRNVTSEQ